MNLGPPSPVASNGLPGSSDPKVVGRGGPPRPPLFGLSPSGVCRAGEVTSPAGELLPHPFTLADRPSRARPAVCFLRHFPCPCGRWSLATTLPCGARTFLEGLAAPAIASPAPVEGDSTSRPCRSSPMSIVARVERRPCRASPGRADARVDQRSSMYRMWEQVRQRTSSPLRTRVRSWVVISMWHSWQCWLRTPAMADPRPRLRILS